LTLIVPSAYDIVGTLNNAVIRPSVHPSFCLFHASSLTTVQFRAVVATQL